MTTSASCLVVLDKKKIPLRKCILVSDTRSIKEVEFIKNLDEFKNVSLDTGMKCSPDLMLPKILWLKNNETYTFENAHYFLNVSDYLNLILTGNCISDKNNLLKFYFSLKTNNYPIKLLDKLDIDVEKFPNAEKVGADIGYIRKSISKKLNLPETCKVILSTYDALAAAFGTGCKDVGDAVDVSGTVTSLRAVTDKSLIDLSIEFIPHHLTKNGLLVDQITWVEE